MDAIASIYDNTTICEISKHLYYDLLSRLDLLREIKELYMRDSELSSDDPPALLLEEMDDESLHDDEGRVSLRTDTDTETDPRDLIVVSTLYEMPSEYPHEEKIKGNKGKG